MTTAPDDVDALRQRALREPAAVLADLEARPLDGSPDHQYLLAELLARSGRSADALDLIDRAEAGFVAAGRELDAWRCDAGRTDVLGNLGRPELALEAATRWLARLATDAVRPRVDPAVVIGALANVGACLEQAGRYPDALGHLDEAIAVAVAAGERVLAALVEINRSNVLNRLGRSTDALAALERAAEVLEAEGMHDDLATVAINAGETACLLGEPDRGLAWFTRAEELVPATGNDAVVVLVESAQALLSLGVVDEAAARARDALGRLADHPLAWLEGRAWAVLGGACRSAGDEHGAHTAFAAAAELFASADNRPGEVQAVLELALLDPAHAVDMARRALTASDPAAWPVQAVAVRLRLAALLSDPDERRAQLVEAVSLADRVAVPHLRLQALHQLGAHLAAVGELDEAERRLRAAEAIVERVRRRLTNETVLRSLPSTTGAVVDDLVAVLVRLGRFGEALVATDRARSRALVDLTSAHDRPVEPEIARLEADLDALYDQLLGLDQRLTLDDRRRLDVLARHLEADLERRRFDLAARGGPAPPGAGLPPAGAGRLELVYEVRGDDVGVFVRSVDGVDHVARVASVAAVTSALESFHAAGRRALALAVRGRAAPVAVGGAATAHLAALGTLVPPAVWHRVRAEGDLDVVIVPTGPLHGVPFHAVLDGGDALVDLAAVSVCPSLALRARCAGGRPAGGHVVLVGNEAPGLPGVLGEVATLGAAMPTARVLAGADATLAAVCEAAGGAARLHLASHGLFRPSAPLQSGVRVADGWLSAPRAAQVDLTGALVVLSACDTGRSVVAAGDELLGLQRGFFQAGAAAVVMSLWPAHDQACQLLMPLLHRGLADGLAPAAALRAAQRHVRAAHPHPWWWAPFVVSGAG